MTQHQGQNLLWIAPTHRHIDDGRTRADRCARSSLWRPSATTRRTVDSTKTEDSSGTTEEGGYLAVLRWSQSNGYLWDDQTTSCYYSLLLLPKEVVGRLATIFNEWQAGPPMNGCPWDVGNSLRLSVCLSVHHMLLLPEEGKTIQSYTYYTTTVAAA